MGKWRRRFVESRLDGLADEPRPGAPRKITDEAVEEVIVATLERQPKDATHWSRASMAAETGLSKSTVGRIWKAFGLKPHQVDTFKLSNDPQFIDKVRDVVGLYLDPPEKALVLCVDEKSPDPGAGPLGAGVADDARDARAAHPRLRPPRHHHLVRRAGRGHRRGHRLDPPPAPGRRVQEVPGQAGQRTCPPTWMST